MARGRRSRHAKRGRPREVGQPRRADGGGRWSARRLAAIVACVVILAGALVAAGLFGGLLAEGGPRAQSAAIVDQLSLTQPNPDFAAKATDLLEKSGYTVDYYPGERVTVDFYRGLPALDYDLIILRVHSGMLWLGNETDATQEEYVSLFTGEPYSVAEYLDEQRDARVVQAVYDWGDDPIFAVSSNFVTRSMQGTFDDTLIVMMGCEGLGTERTGQAFVERGARAFVSWDKKVSAAHSDAVTERLLEHLVIEKLKPQDAVARTATELGPDPVFGAELRILTDGG